MQIPILLYHSITNSSSPKFEHWTATPQTFADHMQVLADGGYSTISVSDLAEIIIGNTWDVPERPVVITFDDGFADFYDQALPILSRFGFRSTIYIITQYMEETSRWLDQEGSGDIPMLSWKQVAEIASQGVEIVAHSHTHPQLDTIPLAQAAQEIRLSKSIIESHLGQQIGSFAYPHGYHNANIRRLVQEAGFSSACAVKHAMSSLEDDRFTLSRIIITHNVKADELSKLLGGYSLRTAPQGERVQTLLWRVVRRTLVHLKGTHQEQPIG
jgi:peptidoglycan/xylan/chitin deacetylase (PgdA/CDA1 family)